MHSNRSPRTSPRMSRRAQQQQSPGGHEASFNSYRSRDSEEEEEEDEIDRSIPSPHRSQDSFGHLSGAGSPSPYSKSQTAGRYGRRGIKDPNSSRSPNEFKRSPKKTPDKSDVGSPHDQSRHSHSSGSPSLYPSLDESDTSGLYPSLDEMYEASPIKNKEQIRSTYMNLRPRPTKPSSKGPSPTKARQESPQQKRSPDSESNNQILLVVVLVLMAAFFMLWYTKAESPKDVGSTLERFIERQQELMKKFPGQEKRLWKTLSAATKRIINDEEPIQPAVILIGSTKSTRREADCIAQQFSKVVTEAFQSSEPVSVDVSKEYIAVSPDDAKVALERSLKNGFNGGAKSAVINGLEDLPGSTAMLLHAFCDNDNAPYTKVVILFTIHSEENYITDKDVEDQLTKIWKRHLNIDDISALLSRVANNIVIAKEEDETVLQQHC